ncbi:hypothetical protein V2I52_21615 [Brenneria sp. g21c3]|uniref:hypothetical protein n=1 Tax=Brenneria sp. g21c3 TaxID=3093893 RepID=UPI002EC43AFA|nr:hypothetical protein [Brenneria sp. g21c3]
MANDVSNHLYKKYENESFVFLKKVISEAEDKNFSVKNLFWLKKDKEACYYFWVSVINLSWGDAFHSKKNDVFYTILPNEYYNKYVVDVLDIFFSSPVHNDRYMVIERFFSSLPMHVKDAENIFKEICERYNKNKENCSLVINKDILMRDDNAVLFFLGYLQKKGMVKGRGFIPVNSLDNKLALNSHLYIESSNLNFFKNLVQNMRKAWSQKKNYKNKTITKKIHQKK